MHVGEETLVARHAHCFSDTAHLPVSPLSSVSSALCPVPRRPLRASNKIRSRKAVSTPGTPYTRHRGCSKTRRACQESRWLSCPHGQRHLRHHSQRHTQPCCGRTHPRLRPGVAPNNPSAHPSARGLRRAHRPRVHLLHPCPPGGHGGRHNAVWVVRSCQEVRPL